MNPLYDYAAHYWGHYAREALTLCQEDVLEFLQKHAQVEASSQALIARKTWPGHKGYSQAFPKLTALHLAAYFGVKVIVQLLLEQGANFSATDSYRQTPLSWAARNGHEGAVALLLEKGAELETKDDDGRTPLSWAAANGRAAVVTLLLEKGADMSIENKSGWTALQLAVLSGYKEVERLLVIHRAPDPKDFYGLEKLFYKE